MEIDIFPLPSTKGVHRYIGIIVFTNPGLLKLPVEQIYAGDETKARDQRMQTRFRMVGLGENLGSGFPLILSAWNEKHWLKPELFEQTELMQVKLVLTIMKHIDETNEISEKNKREMSDVLKNVLKNVQKDVLKKLTDRQIDILELIAHTSSITFNEMSKRIHVSVKTIQRDFTAMRELGIEVIRKGGNTYGEWEIVIDKK